MKKQFQILATSIITIALISCSKDDINNTEPQQLRLEEQTAPNKPGGPITIDPLTVNLAGWFKFDGNLKDQTKKLPDGIPSTRGVIYTSDRNGIADAAIKFNGNYYVKLFNVPQQTHASISAWIRYDDQYNPGRMIITPKLNGLGLSKKHSEIRGSVRSPNFGSLGISAGPVDMTWHHFVVTFDDVYLRIYKDGQLANSILCGASYPLSLEDYFVGYLENEWFVGSVDELRFYNRTLSASDVQQLFNK